MRKVWGCTEMSAALFDLDNDGTLEIYGIGDLCPECYKVYRETMDRFYEGGRHGG